MMKAKLDFYRKVFAEVESGEAAPVYLLKGEEHFIMEEMASRLVDRFVPGDMRSFNLSLDYGSEIDISTFVSTARSFPFLSDRRVMVIRELERLKGKWKPLVEYCGDPVDSTVVILLFSTHDDKGRRIKPPRDFSALEKVVKSKGKTIQFDRLDDRGLRRWVSSRVKRLGFDMDDEGITGLLASAGTDLYDLSNELDKLGVVFEGTRVTGSDVSSVIGSYRMRGIFDVLDSIGRGDTATALEILSRMINSGAERPSVVVYQLIRHFLSLLRIKAGQGGGGYRYDKLKAEAARLSTREIITWLENLRKTEILMKSTVFPEQLLLDSAILHSMNGRLVDRRPEGAGAA
jgi:DNA polymerase-3 subunit delta